LNSTKHLVTSVPPGEQHRGCCTATEGRVRRRSVRSARLDVLPVLRRQGQTHPRQHLEHSAVVRPSARRTFAIRQHLGPQLPSFEPVTIEEVRKLLSTMPCAQVVTARCIAVSTTDVMRSCLRGSHRQTRQPVTADCNVSYPKSVRENRSASVTHHRSRRRSPANTDPCLCLALCCSRSTAARWPTSSLTTAYSITMTPTTRSSISPCAPTTQPPGCPFSKSVALT